MALLATFFLVFMFDLSLFLSMPGRRHAPPPSVTPLLLLFVAIYVDIVVVVVIIVVVPPLPTSAPPSSSFSPMAGISVLTDRSCVRELEVGQNKMKMTEEIGQLATPL